MYQFPVRGLEKIRRTRRKVKNILGEFGLEECLNLGQVCLFCNPHWLHFNKNETRQLKSHFHVYQNNLLF